MHTAFCKFIYKNLHHRYRPASNSVALEPLRIRYRKRARWGLSREGNLGCRQSARNGSWNHFTPSVSSGWVETRSQRDGKKRRKGTGAWKTSSGIINCRDDLITRLNELPAVASRPCRGRWYFFEFRKNGAERHGKNCFYRNDLSWPSPGATWFVNLTRRALSRAFEGDN